MTITVLSDVIVPNSVILAGVSGTQSRQNLRTKNQGGYASVNVVRDVTLRTYQLGIAPMSVSAWADLEGIYEVTDAGAFGMLLQDPKDSSITTAQGALIGYMAGVENGTFGFGNGTALYGLRKLYTASGSTLKSARAITRPKGTPALLRNGSPVTIGVSAGNASLSAAPVYATFVADDTRGLNSITVGATTQVALTSAMSGPLLVGGKLWLQGVGGTAGPVLNNLAHTITNIAANVYTLSVNTAGLTETHGSAAAHKYPQPTDTLTFSSDFYVPVQFRDDDLQWELVVAGARDSRIVSGPSVYLEEIREA
jgi:hypothetical protein